jgi:signal transduction histidine kinase
VSVLAYALLKDRERPKRREKASTFTIFWTVASVCIFAFALTWLATAGDRFLPSLFQGRIEYNRFNTSLWSASLVPIILISLIALWRRRHSVLDYWLILVAWTLVSELSLSVILSDGRFSLGFYAGRLCALGTSLVILILLLGEITKLYTRLARSNTMLAREQSNKLMNVSATAASIAHELKQPLAAIVANADASLEFLAQTPPDLLRLKEALSDIVADGHHTSDALDGVRTLFRNINEQRESVDVNEISSEVLHSMRTVLSDNAVTVEPKLSPDIPRIQGNRGQLQQVIFNLVQNAVEAMIDSADRSRMLWLMTQREDRDRIVVAVQDTGPGIAPERLEDVFEAFMTTKPQGTGLGLAICRIIVERHGGELTAHSDGKNGALFQLSLPIMSAEVSTARP